MGYIYIMTNPCLQNMVKIGYATDVEDRRKQLSTTALPYEYEVYATYETPGNLEDRKLHDIIDMLNPDLRVSKNREFYVITPEDAFSLLKSIAIISGTNLPEKWKEEPPAVNKTIKKTRLTFKMIDVPVGSKLTFKNDENIVVKTADDINKVEYEGDVYSISSVVNIIRNDGLPHHGGAWFKYEGELLTERRERMGK